MSGIATDKAPSPKVVTPHFVAAGIGFVALAILLILYRVDLLGNFFNGHLFAITHIAVLGWMTMIIFGALYQLIPVIINAPLHNETLAKYNFWLFLIGIIGLTTGFLLNSFAILVPLFATFTYIAVILFSYNIISSFKNAQILNMSGRLVITANFWLFLTGTLGIILAFNLHYNLLESSTLQTLKTHIHWGLLGWFVQLVMGVSATLLPMFFVSHALTDKKLQYAFYLLNIGIVVLSIHWLVYPNQFLILFAWLLIALSIGSHASYVYESYQSKVRKLDIGMQASVWAFPALLLPLALSAFLLLSAKTDWSILYIFSALTVFFFPLILGQTYKTLPFIIWLQHYQKFVGKQSVPVPADLFSERIATYHMWSYGVGLLLLLSGIGLRQKSLLLLGTLLFLVTALLYLANVLKIALHKTTMSELVVKEYKAKASMEDEILEILRKIMDPELNTNIVDLGLIYNIDALEPDKVVKVKMTLSTPNCPVGDTIVMSVMEAILEAYPDYEPDVMLVFDPPWTPDMISEAGKKHLAEI